MLMQNIFNYIVMRKIFPLLIFILSSVSLFAQSYEEAKEAFNNGEYKTAITIAEKLTDCPDAKILLGNMYIDGLGMAHADFAKAMKYYNEAADANSAEAQYIIGSLYYSGRGLHQSYAEAAKWYEKSALNGNVVAQSDLGEMYYRGKGIPRDYTKAVKWFEMAVEQNDAKAMFFLGGMYNSKNQGVQTNTLKTAELWRKSAALGYPNAEFYLGQMYMIGRGGITQNADSAMIWIDKAANDGCVDAQFYLGEKALAGGDVEKAKEWYGKAAEKGLQKAQDKLNAITSGL